MKKFSWLKLISFLSTNAAKILSLDTPSFESGKNANIVIFDPLKNGVLIKAHL